MRILTTFFFALLMVVQVSAEQAVEVKGMVKGDDGKALADAELFIKGEASSPIKTDSNGEFSVNLPKGTYIIKVVKSTYANKTVIIEVTGDTDLDVELVKIKASPTSRA